jgi:hypothetical protein
MENQQVIPVNVGYVIREYEKAMNELNREVILLRARVRELEDKLQQALSATTQNTQVTQDNQNTAPVDTTQSVDISQPVDTTTQPVDSNQSMQNPLPSQQ